MRAALTWLGSILLRAGCRPPAAAWERAGRRGDEIAGLRGRCVAGKQPDGNRGLLRGRGGGAVVDSGRHAARAQRDRHCRAEAA